MKIVFSFQVNYLQSELKESMQDMNLRIDRALNGTFFNYSTRKNFFFHNTQ